MSLTKKCRDLYDHMTKGEQQVAAHFMSHKYDFSFHTLDKIAHEAATSTTTVLRFCRQLGFSGYKDFQEALQNEIKTQSNLPDRMRRASSSHFRGDLLEQVVQRDLQNIIQTFADLPTPALEDAVRRISTTKRVYSFGMRESYALAHYAYTRITATRNETYLLEAGYNGMLEPVLNLTPEDVCLVFLFHRYTEQSLRILSLLKKRGVQIILVTSSPYDKVAPFADVILPCLVRIQGVKNSSVVPICLIDYFCNAVASANPESSLIRSEDVEALLQNNDTLGS